MERSNYDVLMVRTQCLKQAIAIAETEESGVVMTKQSVLALAEELEEWCCRGLEKT